MKATEFYKIFGEKIKKAETDNVSNEQFNALIKKIGLPKKFQNINISLATDLDSQIRIYVYSPGRKTITTNLPGADYFTITISSTFSNEIKIKFDNLASFLSVHSELHSSPKTTAETLKAILLRDKKMPTNWQNS